MATVNKLIEANTNFFTIIKANNVEEATQCIVALFLEEGTVVMGEFLAGITLENLNMEQVVDVYARCMSWAENDVILHLNMEDNFINNHGEKLHDAALDHVCKFVGNYADKKEKVLSKI